MTAGRVSLVDDIVRMQWMYLWHSQTALANEAGTA